MNRSVNACALNTHTNQEKGGKLRVVLEASWAPPFRGGEKVTKKPWLADPLRRRGRGRIDRKPDRRAYTGGYLGRQLMPGPLSKPMGGFPRCCCWHKEADKRMPTKQERGPSNRVGHHDPPVQSKKIPGKGVAGTPAATSKQLGGTVRALK